MYLSLAYFLKLHVGFRTYGALRAREDPLGPFLSSQKLNFGSQRCLVVNTIFLRRRFDCKKYGAGPASFGVTAAAHLTIQHPRPVVEHYSKIWVVRTQRLLRNRNSSNIQKV